MLQNAFRDLEPRKWFDRMHPQTLSIATFLLYIDGVFALLRFLDRNDIEGYLRMDGGIFALVTFALIVCYPLGGFLMANGKLLGWYVAIVASFSPFLMRAIFKVDLADFYPWRDVVTGGSLVNLMFEVALCALLLHPMSRTYVQRWLR
jgi:hypothetical protein